MQLTRIAELLEPYLGAPDAQHLTADAYEYISTYIDLLKRWNARVNLTAIRNEEEIVTRHFGESLFAARHLFPKAAESVAKVKSNMRSTSWPPADEAAERRKNAAHGVSRGTNPQQESAPEGRKKSTPTVADIGSGAGFPGIPLKLWAQEISLTLIESNQKKATFLKELARALTLTDINIQTARAETLPNAAFDVVTLRAVERFEQVLSVAARLVTSGGRLALLIGAAQVPIATSTLRTWHWHKSLPVPASEARILAIATTPESRE